jgi:PKD repeat protein
VTAVPPQRFVVTGNHDYSAAGNYWATITIVDEGGSAVKVRSLVIVGKPNNAFIEQAFRDILHRDVDPTGLTFWQNQFAGGLTRADLAAALTHSAEYFANLVMPDYEKFLGRAADAEGLNYWVGRMQQGLTDQQLAAGFASSSEFYASSGGADGGWINALYQSLLDRPVDAQGSAYWLSQLAAGAARQSIALRFTSSAEQATSQLNDDYFNLLGRTPSAGESTYWLDAMRHGATDEQVLTAFLASPEYFQKVQN